MEDDNIDVQVSEDGRKGPVFFTQLPESACVRLHRGNDAEPLEAKAYYRFSFGTRQFVVHDGFGEDIIVAGDVETGFKIAPPVSMGALDVAYYAIGKMFAVGPKRRLAAFSKAGMVGHWLEVLD